MDLPFSASGSDTHTLLGIRTTKNVVFTFKFKFNFEFLKIPVTFSKVCLHYKEYEAYSFNSIIDFLKQNRSFRWALA